MAIIHHFADSRPDGYLESIRKGTSGVRKLAGGGLSTAAGFVYDGDTGDVLRELLEH